MQTTAAGLRLNGAPTLPAAGPGAARRPANRSMPRSDRGRRPRGRPLHRRATADRLHRGASRATARSAGVDVRGASPGTRETELLAPVNAIDRVHAIAARRRQRVRPRRRERRDALARRARHRRDDRRAGRRDAAAVRRADRAGGDPVRPLGRRCARSGPTPRPAMPPAQAASRDAAAEGNVGAGAGASVGKLFGIARAMKGGVGTRVDRGRRASPSPRWSRSTRSATSSIRAPAQSSPARAAKTAARCSARCARCRRGELPAARCASPAGTATTIARRRDRRRADEGRGDQGRADGARRPGAQHQPGPHDGRRRRRLRARDRRERPGRADDAGRRARRRGARRRGAARACAPPLASAATGCPTCRRAADLGRRRREQDRPETRR